MVTTTGTTSDRLIKENEVGSKIDVKNVYGKDHAESFLMMKTDRAKAFVMDDVLLAGLIANDPNPKDYVIAGETLRVEPYAIMFRKDDPQFKKVVDETLIGLMKSGEAEKIYNKWFVNADPAQGHQSEPARRARSSRTRSRTRPTRACDPHPAHGGRVTGTAPVSPGRGCGGVRSAGFLGRHSGPVLETVLTFPPARPRSPCGG